MYVQFQNLAKENATYEKMNFIVHKTKAIFTGNPVHLTHKSQRERSVRQERVGERTWQDESATGIKNVMFERRAKEIKKRKTEPQFKSPFKLN